MQAQFDGIPVPCYVWHCSDGTFTLERANRAAFEMTGERLSAFIGRPVTDVFPDRPEIAGDLERVRTTGEAVQRELGYATGADGVQRRLHVSFVSIGDDRILAHTEDVTALRVSEERLRAVLATVESGLMAIDDTGRVVDVNPAALEILGIPRERLVGDAGWWELISLRDMNGDPLAQDETSPGARAMMRGETTRDVQQQITRPDGAMVAISANYSPLRTGANGEVGGVVVSLTDITEARRLQDRLAHLALHDPLTGLPNRLLFQERLQQALQRPQRDRVAVFLLGLDRFRAVNDTHGHEAGDNVLIEVSTRLHQVLDVAEPLARMGGDEFAVLAECADEREAADLAARLSRTFRAPLQTGSQITASIGIAIEEPGHDAADLIQGADAAVERVKARGGNTFEIFDRAMEGRLRDRLRTEDGLRRAILKDELRLVYQPIVQLDPQRTVALEALVRWQHPEEGLLAPGRFLPVAEQDAQLISDIGRWVLRRACIESRLFPEGIRISVNVAARELGEEGFPERIADTLASTGTSPERIGLEITETTLMEGGDAAIGGLEQLSQHGMYISLDDFGTGYSSLTRLARLPLNAIKLDRGFVARYTGERDRRIIEAAVSIGRAADLNVVAEGVETEDQLELLRASGCGFVQGYLLGRPSPPEQVLQQLASAPT
ncbi:EAL domain-containing protein [Solirubrobacter phytolaccae]|uniref:EAL domain-containing protein n=2 Tax=Solirubrobacter phytolaccae TaxID=1404360 RepID=A0A9X3NDL9_9ACTN|nr:EAL domain-containing protein [Solirubrobacter phytolaccae]